MKQKLFISVLVISLLVLFAMMFFFNNNHSQPQIPESLIGTVWPEPRSLSEFQMQDHLGKTFGTENFLDQWTLVFFGYTSCPDVCPTTLFTLHRVVDSLEKLGEISPRVVMITVDPARDDIETLSSYVTYFDERFLGLRGNNHQLRKLADMIGAMYQTDQADENGDYDVQHSSSIFLIDPQARVYAAFSLPHMAGNISTKLVTIKQHMVK